MGVYPSRGMVQRFRQVRRLDRITTAVRGRNVGAWIKSVERNSLGHTEVVAQIVVAD